MFKLSNSRSLVTAVLLVVGMTLGGNDAWANWRSLADDAPTRVTSRNVAPFGTPDSGEPDIGQTRDRAGGNNGGAPGGGEQFVLTDVRQSSGIVRWLFVMWALRYLGLGS